jgi:Spy/CpxP family protein refolding chaperone
MAKANVSAVHKGAHASLHNALDSYHEQLNQLHQQELQIRQKQAVTKMAALNELSAAKELNLSAAALAPRITFCW